MTNLPNEPENELRHELEARQRLPMPLGIMWRDFEEKERWKVMWGVVWRWALIQIGLLVLIFILVYGFSGAAYL